MNNQRHKALVAQGLNIIDIAIFSVIEEQWNNNNQKEIQISYEEIAEILGLKRIAVLRHTKNLIKAGLIEKKLTYSNAIGRQPNRYIVK